LSDIKQSLEQQNIVINLSFSRLSEQLDENTVKIIDGIDHIDNKLDRIIEQIYLINSQSNTVHPEIARIKTDISNKISHLSSLIQSLNSSISPQDEKNTPDENTFENIDFDDLIDTLENQNCILFIGPEISMDEDNKSLHYNFYDTISSDRIIFNKSDGFFIPGTEGKIINKAKRFYQKEFFPLNKNGNAILEKLAQIPFKLIISYAPDDSMSQIYNKYNIEHQVYEYEPGNEIDIVMNNDTPVIYHAFGNATKNGKYIYTHKQFYEYSQENPNKRIPLALETKLKQEETNYLFIGFDFNKWYFRTIMYYLKIVKSDEQGFVIDKSDYTKNIHKQFISKQFGIDFVNAQYDKFASILLKKSREAGLSKSLNDHFTQSILQQLEKIRIKALDTDKLEILNQLAQELNTIENKIIENRE
jgi:hypothetical protein